MNRMTREEAVEKLEAFAPMVVDDTREALDMAIEALQAEGKKTRCKDCEYLPEYVKQVARACGSNIRAERREP